MLNQASHGSCKNTDELPSKIHITIGSEET